MTVTVVVMGRNYTSRLGMIRAAGMIGCEVHVIKTENKTNVKDKIDFYSKYVRSFYTIKESDEKAILSCLHQNFSYPDKKTILLPTDDPTASLIDRRQDELKEHFLFPHINHKAGAVIHFMDKAIQKELAKAVGLPVAQGWTVYFDGSGYSIPAGVVYPCFVKPQISLKGAKNFMQKCNSKEELEDFLKMVAVKQKDKKDGSSLLIEQFIPIESELAVLGFSNGTEIFIPDIIETTFMHKGVTAVGTIMNIGLFSELREKLEQLMGQIGFCGLFDIDLYKTEGKVYFNEINMRFGASGFAVTYSGVNLPEMLIKTLLEEHITNKKQNFAFSSKIFANEKVCLQEYTSNAITWKQFWKMINDADFNFVKVADDPKPFKEFKRQATILRIKKQILKLVGRKKK